MRATGSGAGADILKDPGLRVLAGTSSTHTFNDSSPSPKLLLNLGVGKSGTTSLSEFLKCNLIEAKHFYCQSSTMFVNTSSAAMPHWLCAVALHKFIARERSRPTPLPSNDFERELRLALTQKDELAFTEMSDGYRCLFPQVKHAAWLVENLPHACFTLTSRPAKSWARSVSAWPGLKDAMFATCPNGTFSSLDEAGLEHWYEEHLASARKAIANARCGFEISLNDPDAGVALMRAHGYSANPTCTWPHTNHYASLQPANASPNALQTTHATTAHLPAHQHSPSWISWLQ